MLHRLCTAFAVQSFAQEKQALRLVQTIPLPRVKGRLDHMGVDLEQKCLFLAAVANNTLEVVDLTAGKLINSLAVFKDTRDALFLGGDFSKLLPGQRSHKEGRNPGFRPYRFTNWLRGSDLN
jgi:hypothetical protein